MIISNTTPISNFLQLERFDLLKRLFPVLHISQAVKREIDVVFAAHRVWQTSLQDDFIVVHEVASSDLRRHFLSVLHPGEAEALCLYLEQHADLCLVDDRDARAIATLHHIKLTGTLGILIQAKQRGVIDIVHPLLNRLREEHIFWISAEMYDTVLHLTGE